MAYYNIERGKLPTTHPYYKANSTALVNPLCLQSRANYNVAPYYDPDVNPSKNKRYLTNPMTEFLADSDHFLNGKVGVLYAGYGLGLENSLQTFSISTESSGTFTVRKNSDYGYDVLASGYTVGEMSKIAPIIYFELTGGGGGGGGSYSSGSMYGSGGGGGGGCIRGLIDLSRISNIYFQVGAGGAGGTQKASGKYGGSSWISVANTSDQLLAGGGASGTVYANGAGGLGGSGGTCYRAYNGNNITPGGLSKGSPQTGLYVLAASSGGRGGNGARGDGKPATVGAGASIDGYNLAGAIIISKSSTANTSLMTPTGTDLSSYGGHVAGGGGGSAVGKGGCPGIGYAIYNNQYSGQDPGAGSFPGGGGGGACCVNATNDYYTGGKGANGRLKIHFAYMPEPK